MIVLEFIGLIQKLVSFNLKRQMVRKILNPNSVLVGAQYSISEKIKLL